MITHPSQDPAVQSHTSWCRDALHRYERHNDRYLLRCVLVTRCMHPVQLYNEEVNDLLAQDNTKLQIHESKESGIYVAGLREEIVTSVEHVLQLLEEGDRLRHVGETKMNKNSSRSHSIFRMASA